MGPLRAQDLISTACVHISDLKLEIWGNSSIFLTLIYHLSKGGNDSTYYAVLMIK